MSPIDAFVARARDRSGAGLSEVRLDEIEAAQRPPGDLLSVGELWRPHWTPARLRRLVDELGEDRLFVVEPVSGLGLRRVLQWVTTPIWRRRRGHTFNRDLPIQLRAAGLEFHEIDRFSTGPLGLCTYAYVEAAQSRRHAGDEY